MHIVSAYVYRVCLWALWSCRLRTLRCRRSLEGIRCNRWFGLATPPFCTASPAPLPCSWPSARRAKTAMTCTTRPSASCRSRCATRGTATRWRGSRSRRVDQIFLACGPLAVLGNLLRLQRPSERHHFGVVARKRRRDLRRDPMLQACRGLWGNAPQEISQQPPANAPRHAVRAVEHRRPDLQGSINVDLLLHRGAVTAELLGAAARRSFHRRQDVTGELPPPVASKPNVAPVSARALVRSSVNVG